MKIVVLILSIVAIWILFQVVSGKKQVAVNQNLKKEIPLDYQSLNDEIVVAELPSQGTIPSWLKGTLIRNGPAKWDVGSQRISHWFDGLAMLHAFSFQNGKVGYANKFLRSDDYRAVNEGRIPYGSFASDPCRSIFNRFLTFFTSEPDDEIHNANINVAHLADKYVALYEVPLPVEFDPKTLETLGVLDYKDELPKKKCWESAHPHYSHDHKETINYLIKYGRQSEYIFYRIKDGSSARDILVSIPVDQPAYMHSFAATPKYLILTEYPFVVSPIDLLTNKKSFIYNFAWKPERGTRFVVIDRANGSVVKTETTSAFFSFHHINAYEDNDKLVIDLIAYDNVDIIFDLGSTRSADNGAPPLPEMRFVRYELYLTKPGIKEELLANIEGELPRINDILDGKHYRYVYASDVRSPVNPELDVRAITKLDVGTKNAMTWKEKGCYPGEPVFVASPESKAEDDGVVLSVVLDANTRRSFVVVLDAKTMSELGRAAVPHHIPSGLHGQFYNIQR